MTGIERVAVSLLVAVIVLVGTYVFGWHKGYNASEAVWKAEKATLVAKANEEAARLRAEGSRLSAELQVAKANVRVEYVEVIRGVQKIASSTRRAIGADLAGLLNSMSGIRETTERLDPAGVVEARRETATNSGRPASDSVSERALGEWIAGAVKAHEECRSQANALIEYARVCSK